MSGGTLPGGQVRLRVNEIFWSLQGEGRFTGTPAAFIRLQGCQVGCPWCDTGYAQRADEALRLPDESPLVAEKTASSGAWSAFEAGRLADFVAVRSLPGMHCVLTGGEPCSQDILPLTRRLMEAGLAVQLETSGTEPLRCAGGVFVTLSPKARAPLEASWARANEVKLPVQTRADIERYEQKLAALPPAMVCLQPVSQGREATALCIQTCMERGWRLSLQMHKYLDIR